MSLSATAVRRAPRAVTLASADARDRSVRRRVSAAWGLLYLNTLVFTSGSILHIPSFIGKGLTQGSLPLAILVLLTINPKVNVRPNVFLCLVSLLAVDTIITASIPYHLGTVYRTARLVEFVVALWLLTPWWGRQDMLLLRCHLRWLLVALSTVVLGFLIAPGRSRSFDGRLSGVIWPMDPTQIAQYAAVAIGIMILLWLARMLSGRITLIVVAVLLAVLLLTHTRTALAALAAGILVAGLSLFIVNARVRRFFAVGAVLVSIGVAAAATAITSWLARGENTQGLITLTGRTNFWALVVSQPRTEFELIFGFGLSNASIDGLPIDSNWFASYMMEGLFGVIVCAIILVWLWTHAFFQPHGTQRAIALFLISYCTVASFTEVGFTDVSTYLMNLVVAASLLVTLPSLQRKPAGQPLRAAPRP
jgi:hypothetical protein